MNPEIAAYALLSNCRSGALVSSSGSIDWLCLPRYDSPAMFARLLGEDAGHFSIGIQSCVSSERRYCESSLVLETSFSSEEGCCVLTDVLALSEGKRGHDLGENSPALLLRTVRCVAGSVPVHLDLAPRFDYGLVQPLFSTARGGAYGRGGASVLFFSTEKPFHCSAGALSSAFTLVEGEQTTFGLECASSIDPPPRPRSQRSMRALLEDTKKGWRSWSALHQRYEGCWREQVAHSGIIPAQICFCTGVERRCNKMIRHSAVYPSKHKTAP